MCRVLPTFLPNCFCDILNTSFLTQVYNLEVAVTVFLFFFPIKASRKWLESLYPTPDKRQRTANNVSKRSHGMPDAEVEKKVREVVVARFYSLAKVNWYSVFLLSLSSCLTTDTDILY